MKNFRYLDDKDLWMLAEDIPDIDFFFSEIWLSCFVNQFSWPGGKAYKKILSIYKGYHLWFYYGEKDSKKVGEHLVEKFIKNLSFVKKVNKEIINWSDKLRNYTKKLPETRLDRYSNQQLLKFCQQHDKIHTQYYQWGWIPVAADMFHANLTEKIKSYLRNLGIKEGKINENLILLTQPTKKSLIQIQEEEFSKIGIKIQKDSYHFKLFKELFEKFKEREVSRYGFETHSLEYERLFEETVQEIKNKIKPRIYKLIQKHYEKYFYVNRLWVGQVSTFEYFLKELVRRVAGGVNLEQKYKNQNKELVKNITKRKALINRLKIKEPWLTITDAFGDFMVTKIYRRFAQIYALYKMQFILEEIGKRLNLSLKEVRFMLPHEREKALSRKKFNKKIIKERTKLCVLYADKNAEEIFIGKKAKKLIKLTQRKIEKVIELKGQCGCVGRARGTVKIIIRPKDMQKMKKGDVLVSIATDPDIVSAMKKAAAIVTEQGGVTSHAAIIARELGIPCVIGTKIATRVFKDGDLVEVDADKGIVRKIK